MLVLYFLFPKDFEAFCSPVLALPNDILAPPALNSIMPDPTSQTVYTHTSCSAPNTANNFAITL